MSEVATAAAAADATPDSALSSIARAARRRTEPALASIALLVASLASLACTTFSSLQKEASYSPTEGVLEAIAVLRRHVPDDTYRFPPARDFTGRNVYRASLLRLENLERAEADALRSGYMDGVIAFGKARALERLRAFDLAAQQYRLSARRSDDLRATALASAEICDRLQAASKIGIELVDPIAESGVPARPIDPEAVRRDLDERVARLSLILDELDADRRGGADATTDPGETPAATGDGDARDVADVAEPGDGVPAGGADERASDRASVDRGHYRWIAQEEIERADLIRALYFVEIRHVVPDGTVVALQELQRVATRHGASKNRLRHLLRLGDFYAELAREYLDAIPPESLVFDPARFRELADASIQLYELVSSHDGRPEKLEATRKLEAFLALTLTIDADRFDR